MKETPFAFGADNCREHLLHEYLLL